MVQPGGASAAPINEAGAHPSDSCDCEGGGGGACRIGGPAKAPRARVHGQGTRPLTALAWEACACARCVARIGSSGVALLPLHRCPLTGRRLATRSLSSCTQFSSGTALLNLTPLKPQKVARSPCQCCASQVGAAALWSLWSHAAENSNGRQATKEAEYRERVADLKARIDSYQERIAAEEGHSRSAKVRAYPGPRYKSSASPVFAAEEGRCRSARIRQGSGLP